MATDTAGTTTDIALTLALQGYHVVPLEAQSKACVDRDWPSLRLTPEDVPRRFKKGHGVGVLLGTEVAKGCFLVGIDIDVDDDLLIERVRLAFSSPPPAKRGAKGLTFFARADEAMKKKFCKRKGPDGKNINVIEILGLGQQTVLPPSIHPNGKPYEWVTPHSLTRMSPLELPVLDYWVLQEINLAASKPDSPVFLINDMTPSSPGEPGTIHNSILTATAALVAHNWPDDAIWRRIDRATRLADPDDERPKWEETVRKMIEDSRSKGHAVVKKEKPHAIAARWMLDGWRGPGMAMNLGGMLSAYEDGYYRAYSRPDLCHAIATAYPEPATVSFVASDWNAIADTVLTKAKRFPTSIPRHRVCLLNGTFDMDDGEMLPWSPDDYLINQLPFHYDPEARCPTYEQAITRALTDPEDPDNVAERDRAINTYEEFVSHTLFECLDFHRFLVLLGKPRTGKSTLTDVAVLFQGGVQRVSSVSLSGLADERSRTSMVGRLLNVTDEVADASHAADDVLKAVVAGGLVQVRQLYQEPYSLRLPTRLIISANNMFRVRDTSGAIEERMIVLTCNNYLEPNERMPHERMLAALRGELPGIFNRMVTAWRRLRARGNFDPPESHLTQVQSFSEENNHTLRWFLTRTHQGLKLENPDYELPKRLEPTEGPVLYVDFAEWSKANGFKQMSSITWGMKLSQIKAPGVDLSTQTKWVGKRMVRVRNITLLNESVY